MNLFVYGTLISEHNQKIVTGKVFPRDRAILKNYRKVMSAECFPFIIPYRGTEVEGYILYSIDENSLNRMDRYEAEGDLYKRKSVEVYVDGKTTPVFCEVYVGNVRSIREHFMPGTDIDDRIEKYVESEIDEIILQDSLKQQDYLQALQNKRIIKELFGSTVEEIVKAHVSRFNLPLSFLAKNLYSSGLPTLKNIRNNPEIAPYADNYISFAVKHIIFNQLEDHVRADFTGEVKVAHKFYEHTISVLLALEHMNRQAAKVEYLMNEYGLNIFHADWEYIDYAEKAIKIADSIYNKMELASRVEVIKKNRNCGIIPLGAEVEFSTIGRHTVEKGKPLDPEYNCFHYFHDFDLTRRLWKLGGHLDDHCFPDPTKPRSYGFLEYAFGRFRIYGDLSKPVTVDPWVLNRLINEATKFSGVRPHSLHISIQAGNSIQFEKKNKIEHLICLLLLGGDLGYDLQGKLREKRIYHGEIIDKAGLLRFNLENIHYSDEDKLNRSTVIEYQFPRLYSEFNYQPLILALKGYQIAKNPRPLCPAENLNAIGYYEMEHLREWAASPYPVSEKEIHKFLSIVEDGLMGENEGRPAHKLTYIRKNLALINIQIKAKNKFVQLNT